MNDLSTRDYNVNDIGEVDGRFVDCKKEALIIQISCLSVTILGVIIAYVLSPTTANATSNTYLFGYPTWVMVPALLFAAQSVFFIFMATKKFKKPSLAARAENVEEVD